MILRTAVRRIPALLVAASHRDPAPARARGGAFRAGQLRPRTGSDRPLAVHRPDRPDVLGAPRDRQQGRPCRRGRHDRRLGDGRGDDDDLSADRAAGPGRVPGQVGEHRRRRRRPAPAHRDVHRRARCLGVGSASTQPSATTAATTPPSAAPSAGPTPAPSPEAGETGSGSDVVVPIIVALIILGAGAAYLLTRRNRPTGPA